jgi:nucleotide-binding universal stress UspA family protein
VWRGLSRPPLYAVSQAIALAVEAAGFLTLVHVVPHARQSWPNKLPRLIQRLRNLVGHEVRSACGVREIVTAGRPVDELLKVVRRESADLLVLGIADRAGTNESAGTLAAIAREQAELPVLLVRADAGRHVPDDKNGGKIQSTVRRSKPQAGDVLVSRRRARADVYAISVIDGSEQSVARRYDHAIGRGSSLARDHAVDAWYTADHTHFVPVARHRTDFR